MPKIGPPMAPNWNTSTRRQRLPKNWQELRETTKALAQGRCQAISPQGTRCTEIGNQCDHIVPGDDHSQTNLQWLCEWHHNRKSSAEGRANRPRYTERHPKEKHPGLN